ncbi:MAG: MFS transporter [Trueperaceae bacterium]|nr:MFS transporter [Trueperaceae bacterium]
MFLPKAFYFFYYAAYAALMPFLVVYFEKLGFSAGQIGILGAIMPLMTMLAAPFWANLVDSSKRQKTFLVSLLLVAIVSGISMGFSSTFTLLMALMLLFAFVIAPVMPLGDNAILRLLGEQRKNYGRLRVWGAVGWGLSAPIVGFITEKLDLRWAFYSFALLMVGCLVSIYRLTFPPGQPQQSRSFAGFLQPAWLIFLATIFMAGLSLAVSNNFLYLYLTELNAPARVIGLALTVATISELPITYFGRQLLERFNTRSLLLIALLALALRLFLYSIASVPVFVLAIQLLHGLCFSVIWIAGVNFAAEFAPTGKTATAQSLFTAVMMGLGSTIGNLIGGFFYDQMGPQFTFRIAALIALLAVLLVFAAGSRLTQSLTLETNPQS